MMSLTSTALIRVDKVIVGAIGIFALGWTACYGLYNTQWLEYRAAAFAQVSQDVAPGASTPVAVVDAKKLVQKGRIADALGCPD